jgi:hypothetical protein
MAGKGGYQKPNKPATNSGPGKYSRRTDGGPGDMRQAQRRLGSIGYGEGADTAAIQAGAPLSATGGAAGIQPTPMQAPRPKLVPIDAETQRPDEPITAGMPFGEGPGPEALPNFRQQEADVVMKYLPSLNALAEEPDTPQSFRLFVRYLQGNM